MSNAQGAERAAPPLVSVIVVNWNVAELLEASLRSLEREMTLDPDQWELIVVDNASSDGSAAMVAAQFPRARLIVNDQNVGFGRANNQAARIARGRRLLLLNPDTIVLEGAIEGMLRWMEERPSVGIAGGRLLNSDGTFQRWTGGNRPTTGNAICHFLLLYKVLPQSILPQPLYLEEDLREDTEVGWVSGAFMLLRREAVGEELFDERFFLYGEDVDLCRRTAARGWKVVYTPRFAIIHHGGRSLARQSSEIALSRIRSTRLLFAASHGRASVFLYDLVVLAGFALRLAINGALALARPRSVFGERARTSGRYLAEAARVLRALGSPGGA